LEEGITIFMTTPYLDEAERCTRVGLMSGGNILLTDTPKNVKKQMRGSVIEIIPNELQRVAGLLASFPNTIEVQTFGDRINVVVEEGVEPNKLKEWLESRGTSVRSARTIQPSLENVFIALLRDRDSSKTETIPAEEKGEVHA